MSASPRELLTKPVGMSWVEWERIVRGREAPPETPPPTPRVTEEAARAQVRTTRPELFQKTPPPATTPTAPPLGTTTAPSAPAATPTTVETPAAVRLRVATDIATQLSRWGIYQTPEGLATYMKTPSAADLVFRTAEGTVTVPMAEFERSMKDYEVAYAKYNMDQVLQITSQALKAMGQQILVSKALGPSGVELLTTPKPTIDEMVANFNRDFQRGVFPLGTPSPVFASQQHLKGMLDVIMSADFGDYFAYQKIAAIQKGIVYPSDIPVTLTGIYYKEGVQETLRPKTAAQTFEEAEARFNEYLLHGTSLSYRLGDLPIFGSVARGFMKGAEDITNIGIGITGVILPQPVSKTGGLFESPVGIKGISVQQPSMIEQLAEFAGQMVVFQGIFTAGRVISSAVVEGTTTAIRETGAGIARAIGMPAETVDVMRTLADVRTGGAQLGLKWTFIGQPITRYWGETAITSYEGGLLAPFIEPWPWSVIKEVPTFTPEEILRNPQLSRYLFNQPSIGAKIDMSAYELIRPTGLVNVSTITEKIAGTNLAFDERLGGYFKVSAGGESGLFVTTTERFAALEKSVFVERGTLDRILNFQLESGQFGITAPYTTPLKLSLKTDIGTLETTMKPMIEITEVSQREVFNLGNAAIAKTTRWYPIAPEGLGDLTDIGWISRQDLLAIYRSKSWIDLEVIRNQTKFLGEQPFLDLTKAVPEGAIPPSIGKTVYTFSRVDLGILDITKDFTKIESATLGFGVSEYVPKTTSIIKAVFGERPVVLGAMEPIAEVTPGADLVSRYVMYPSAPEIIPSAKGVTLADTITKTTRLLNQVVFEETPIVFPAVETDARDIIAQGAARTAGVGILLGAFPTIKLGAMSNIGADMARTQRDLSRMAQPIIFRHAPVEAPTIKEEDIAKLLPFSTPIPDIEPAQKTALITTTAMITTIGTPQITPPTFDIPPPDIPPDFVPIIPPFESSVYMSFPKKRRAKVGKKKYTERLWYVGPLEPKMPKLKVSKAFKAGTPKLPKLNVKSPKFPTPKMPKLNATKMRMPRMKKMRRMV